MTRDETEERLGIPLTTMGIPIEKMITSKDRLLGEDVIGRLKEKIYNSLVDYLKVIGYPTEANSHYKEANINDLVVFTIYPILAAFKEETSRGLFLTREKEITSKDSSTSGRDEFMVLDFIRVGQKNYVAIVEAKKVSLGEAQKQCYLAMHDMRDWNGGGVVYGFITMGDSWRMISYDGNFKITEKIELVFDSMADDKERWINDYSILIDCLNVAFSNGASCND
ncbi:hypothetical protein B9Z19DRAFT_1061476 [Tuber borchii]|uniref:Type I restriction enzyme R protein N-terminal domain-containing protein n=1 Tax=Tuber borchii TaxID=42251 RepID=A0A2T7A5B6_TUBBO|nr:hypothetical protein B9Z19DRAFT_1061476 [Tuber borchii]